MKNFSAGPVGLFYIKWPRESAPNGVLVREAVGNFHVCVQDKHSSELYQIVAEVLDRDLAEEIAAQLRLKNRSAQIELLPPSTALSRRNLPSSGRLP